MIIKSGYLEFKQIEKNLVLQIGVRILKENLTCRCEFETYNKNTDTLIMTGLPLVYKNDDIFRASKITVFLENDEIQMDGKVEGSLIIEDQEEENENNSE
jgi:lipopolysaccharide export system protein LptA